MLKEERCSRICDILEKEKFVTVERLSELLFFSRPTIRRDLALLEREGRVKRSHGGAMPGGESENDIPIGFRSTTKHAEKMKMCKRAVELVCEGNVIFIDGSTTASGVASFLPEDKNLTVVTNSLVVSEALAGKNIRTYCTGGRLIPKSRAFAGSWAEAFVRGFCADIMFFSSSALSNDGKICDYSDTETNLRRAMLDNSRCRVFMCDETKFGKHSAYVPGTLSEVDYIITDIPLPECFGKENLRKNICL